MQFVATVEKHPYAIAGGVVALGLVFILLKGSSSGGTAVAPSGTDPNTQLALAQIQAQMQGQQAQITGQVDLANLNNSAAITVQQLQANTAQLTIAGDIQKTQLLVSGQESITDSNNNAAIAIAQANAKASTDITALQTQATVLLGEATTKASIDIASINATQNISIAAFNNDTQKMIAQYQSNVAIAQANSNAEVGIAQTQAAVAIAKNSGGNSWASILGGIAGLVR